MDQLFHALRPTATAAETLLHAAANGTQGPSLSPNGTPASPQFMLLDMLIPGFSTFSHVLHTYTGLDLNMYIPLIMLASLAMWSSSYLSSSCWQLLEKYFMCSVRINIDDEIYDMIMTWVAHQSFCQRSRNFMANTESNARSWNMMYRYGSGSDEEDDDGRGGGYNFRDKKRTALRFTPSYGSHRFWYKRRLLFFARDINNADGRQSFHSAKNEEVTISCLWWSPGVLKALLDEAREQYISRDENKTIIYRGTSSLQEGNQWTRCMARASRPFSTVILDEKVKSDLIADVTDYLDPVTQKWYSNRGIPYRRGYLLYGPPGTGKSSLSLALAGFFGLRIYILSLSSPSATEENVASLFSSLPRKCVVLLEDIDSAGLTHTRDAVTEAASKDKGNDKEGEQEQQQGEQTGPRLAIHGGHMIAQASRGPWGISRPGQAQAGSGGSGKLSLSGLLNILDGVASQEGRVLIMTTNHLEKLDKALIRPGRVDMVVRFGRANSDMAASIFQAIYAPYEGEATPPALIRDIKEGVKEVEDVVSEEMTEEEKVAAGRAATMRRVRDLASQFAAKIPDGEFSPAELQGLLLKHKRDPLAAIDAVEAFIETTRQERAEKVIRDEQKQEEEAEEAEEAEEEKEKEEKEKNEGKAKEAEETSKKGKKK